MGLRPLNKLTLPCLGGYIGRKFANTHKNRCPAQPNETGRESLLGLPDFVDCPQRLAVATIVTVMMIAACDRTADHGADQRTGEHAANVAAAIAIVAIVAV